MIKLTLPDKPRELTPEMELALIGQFESDRKDPVWQKAYIKDAVFNIAHGKCAYSEVKLQEEGKDMQIDHFYPKSLYSRRIVEWGNLLPSLNHCNRHKGNTDPNAIDLINPLIDNPKECFYFQRGFLCHKNNKGENTIDIMKLNDQDRLNIPRCKLLKGVGDSLIDIEPWYDIDINYFIKRLKEIMQKGKRTMAYSAAVATFILENDNFIFYKSLLDNNSLWDAEFQAIEEELEFCSLPK